MNEPRNTVGDRLRIFREHLNLTQAQLAEVLQTSTTGLQQNERDKALPGGKLLIALYQRGLNINWLLSGDEDEGMFIGGLPKNGFSSHDLQLYGDALEVIELYLEKTKKTMSPANKRKAVDALYKLSREKNRIDPAVIEMFVQLAA